MTVIRSAKGTEVEWFGSTEAMHTRLNQVIRSRMLRGFYKAEDQNQVLWVLSSRDPLDAVHFLRTRRHHSAEEHFEYHRVANDYAKVVV